MNRDEVRFETTVKVAFPPSTKAVRLVVSCARVLLMMLTVQTLSGRVNLETRVQISFAYPDGDPLSDSANHPAAVLGPIGRDLRAPSLIQHV